LRLGSFDQTRGIIDEEFEAVWVDDKDAQPAMNGAKARDDGLP
jgi:sn-glycerol 3-phosphate transport system substrate-binding protein